MFWNICYIFIDEDSTAGTQLLASVYERDQHSLVLSGADLATVTRLHWGGTQEAAFIIALLIGKIRAVQQALSLKHPLFSIMIMWGKNVEPFSVLPHGQSISLNASRLANLPVSQTKTCSFLIISASMSLSSKTHVKKSVCNHSCICILRVRVNGRVFSVQRNKSNSICLFPLNVLRSHPNPYLRTYSGLLFMVRLQF